MKKSITVKKALDALKWLSHDIIFSDMSDYHKTQMLRNIRIQASLKLDAYEEIAEYQANKFKSLLDHNLLD